MGRDELLTSGFEVGPIVLLLAQELLENRSGVTGVCLPVLLEAFAPGRQRPVQRCNTEEIDFADDLIPGADGERNPVRPPLALAELLLHVWSCRSEERRIVCHGRLPFAVDPLVAKRIAPPS